MRIMLAAVLVFQLSGCFDEVEELNKYCEMKGAIDESAPIDMRYAMAGALAWDAVSKSNSSLQNAISNTVSHAPRARHRAFVRYAEEHLGLKGWKCNALEPTPDDVLHATTRATKRCAKIGEQLDRGATPEKAIAATEPFVGPVPPGTGAKKALKLLKQYAGDWGIEWNCPRLAEAIEHSPAKVETAGAK